MKHLMKHRWAALTSLRYAFACASSNSRDDYTTYYIQGAEIQQMMVSRDGQDNPSSSPCTRSVSRLCVCARERQACKEHGKAPYARIASTYKPNLGSKCLHGTRQHGLPEPEIVNGTWIGSQDVTESSTYMKVGSRL